MTPPILQDENKPSNENSEASISEHLTINSGGTENDRSFQEIEISYQPSMLLNLSATEEDEYNTTPEKPSSVQQNEDHSSDEGEQSLEALESNVIDSEGPNRARSILEEILSNDQFQSNQDTSVHNSREESFNMFGNVNLDDEALANFKDNIGLDEKNLYASDFHFPLINDENDIQKTMRDFEELIAVKDSAIAALTSELDSVREGSHTNTGSTLSTTEYKQLQEECHNKVWAFK